MIAHQATGMNLPFHLGAGLGVRSYSAVALCFNGPLKPGLKPPNPSPELLNRANLSRFVAAKAFLQVELYVGSVGERKNGFAALLRTISGLLRST